MATARGWILEHREPERVGAIEEHSAAQMPLILDDPLAAAVLAEQEYRCPSRRSRRVNFNLAHESSPLPGRECADQRI
jgi:hypothetical protein